MSLPFERQPGYVPCHHCAAFEGKVACRGCRYLVCGTCALSGCPDEEASDGPEAARTFDSLRVDPVAGTFTCDGDRARIADVLEVIVECGKSLARGDLGYQYQVRIVLGDRAADFLPVRLRSRNPMRDLDRLVVACGDEIARALGVKWRVERG